MQSFEEVFFMQRRRVMGDNIRIFKCYGSKWQVRQPPPVHLATPASVHALPCQQLVALTSDKPLCLSLHNHGGASLTMGAQECRGSHELESHGKATPSDVALLACRCTTCGPTARVRCW